MTDSRIALPPPAGLARINTNMWTQPFWDAAARHMLVVPRCGGCGTYRMPPTPFCPVCRSQEIAWTEIIGDGAVYSYTIVERAIVPGTESSLPYVPAIIELPQADGVRLISNIVDTPIGQIRVGVAAKLVWQDLPDGISLPQFRLA